MAVIRPKWLTEKQICDYIESDTENTINKTLPGLTSVVWHREYELMSGEYRADFLGLSLHYGIRAQINVVEVKICADIHTLSQLAEYMNIAKDTMLAEDRFYPGIDIVVDGIVVARYFDKSIYPLAQALNISLLRVSVDDEKILIAPESFGSWDTDYPIQFCSKTYEDFEQFMRQNNLNKQQTKTWLG